MTDRIQRHKAIDRAYHWLMAVAMLILLVTAFLPILGLKFEWVGIHWVTGLVLAILVLFHIIRACFFQNFWAMMIDSTDLKAPLAKPGKYDLAQKERQLERLRLKGYDPDSPAGRCGSTSRGSARPCAAAPARPRPNRTRHAASG